MKLKKVFLYILAISILVIGYGCETDPEDPTDPIDPIDPVIEKTPLEIALESFSDVDSYTMSITFESETSTYPMTIKIDQQNAEIDALDEVIYYEVDGSLCYIYEFKATSWSKSPTTCSSKTSQELSFITNFSEDYFDEATTNNYQLKTNYYDILNGFLGSTSTTNFNLVLQNDVIYQMSFTMIRNAYEFDITITLSNFNQTNVTLPQVS